jgi:hypothetical protein
MSNDWKAICSDETQQIVYACSYDGGIYKSIDGGQSFIAIYENTDIKYLNISCDKTGDYFICGCTQSFIICSLNGGGEILGPLKLSDLNYEINEVHVNPDAENIDKENISIFICGIKGGPQMIYIYKNLSFFRKDLSYILGTMCITSDYIMILGISNSTIQTYEYPKIKDTGITTSISSISGLTFIDQRYIKCNENYVCYFGKNEGTEEYSIWVMEITHLSKVVKIPSNKDVKCLTISESSCVYEDNNLFFGEFKIIKYFNFNFNENTCDFEKIYSFVDPLMIITIIYTNPYNIVNPDIQPLLIANDISNIYYSEYIGDFNTLNFIESNISCFLENTKIRILKNNEACDELIQNLKLDDDVIISNGETRKLKFIGYNFMSVNNIKNIAKIKKDVLGLNEPCQDLYIITGHSLLFKEIPDNIKNEYYDETIYNTTVYDDYKKIIALHTNIYETPTPEELNVINYKIKYFHIALENENKDEHYAIYSNNILTETMTLNYVKKSNLIPL